MYTGSMPFLIQAETLDRLLLSYFVCFSYFIVTVTDELKCEHHQSY